MLSNFIILNAEFIGSEMLHVKQKSEKCKVEDKNEREFQAYYENISTKEFPLIPELSNFTKSIWQQSLRDITTEWKKVLYCKKGMLNRRGS
ncbi:MAG: hypothetical protein R2790_04270 [Flavobacterium haoranii]